MRQSPALAGPGFPDWEAVDAAIGDGAEAAFEFLERLVASPSTVGRELPAQQIVAAELDRLRFEVSELRVPPETAAQAPAGVAQADYAGRPDVLGRLNPGGAPSLLLNGHVDVVPAESGRWASDPFTPVRTGGWLTGRGAGDMKGGFAMGLLAVAALRQRLRLVVGKDGVEVGGEVRDSPHEVVPIDLAGFVTILQAHGQLHRHHLVVDEGGHCGRIAFHRNVFHRNAEAALQVARDAGEFFQEAGFVLVRNRREYETGFRLGERLERQHDERGSKTRSAHG